LGCGGHFHLLQNVNVRSSRQIERFCHTDVAYRILCAQDVPDHSTIARFRRQSLHAFEELFAQVLMIAGRSGLGKFGTLAIDGTKIAANASIDANRSEEWIQAEFRKQAAAIVEEAEAVDAAEDIANEPDGQFLSPELGNRNERRNRIRQAIKEIQVAREKDVAKRQAKAPYRKAKIDAGLTFVGKLPGGQEGVEIAESRLAAAIAKQEDVHGRWRAKRIALGRTPNGRIPVPIEQHGKVIRAQKMVENAKRRAEEAAARPMKRYQANTTDPQSRLMPTRKGFVQGYNVQVGVTADQLIAVINAVQDPNDLDQFIPMLRAGREAAIKLHTISGSKDHEIGMVLADAGYCSDANITAAGPDRLIATSKSRNVTQAAIQYPESGEPPSDITVVQAMTHRLRTPEGAQLYKKRAATVETGIANLKKLLPRFSLRGLDAVIAEARLAATAFNLRKIHNMAIG
jgi:hypothetical protein